jgi:hypothetical protein
VRGHSEQTEEPIFQIVIARSAKRCMAIFASRKVRLHRTILTIACPNSSENDYRWCFRVIRETCAQGICGFIVFEFLSVILHFDF